MSVTTQEELDAAIAAGKDRIVIDSPRDVWLRVEGSARVVARGSSRVEAWDLSTVEARESSSVIAWGLSRVEAWDSSIVVARDSSSVIAWESAHVEARDSAHVKAWAASTVVARGSARVVARGSARVVARGSARVEARESSTVEARESSRVTAAKFAAVHLHSANATVSGGVVIDITALDLTDLADWAEYHGVKVEGGEAIVYKAVDAELRSGHGFAYPIGETVECPDWKADAECGHGLHLSPSPTQARDYFGRAKRFLRCAVPVDEAVVLEGSELRLSPKLKARTVRVLCEVDIYGHEITKENK